MGGNLFLYPDKYSKDKLLGDLRNLVVALKNISLRNKFSFKNKF